MRSKIQTSVAIEVLLRQRHRLTIGQIAAALFLTHDEATEEVMHLHNLGRVERFKTTLGLLVWMLSEEALEEGKGKSGAGALTLDMKPTVIEPMMEAELTGSMKTWRAARAAPVATSGLSFDDWGKAIDEAKEAWVKQNKKSVGSKK